VKEDGKQVETGEVEEGRTRGGGGRETGRDGRGGGGLETWKRAGREVESDRTRGGRVSVVRWVWTDQCGECGRKAGSKPLVCGLDSVSGRIFGWRYRGSRGRDLWVREAPGGV
jgi:hypothetical protein